MAARLILRADGGPDLGWGHVARCFALAQAWTEAGGAATMATRSPSADWAERFEAEGVDVREPEGLDYGRADWVALDGYQFRAPDRVGMGRILQIDDHGLSEPAGAGVILDQNLGATDARYRDRNGARLLLGPQYAMLRREFRGRRAERRPGRRLLVSMGGSPTDATQAAFAAVIERAGLEAIMLTGVADVASAMAGADLALAASGSTCWELCCMGLPTVLVSVAANQAPLAQALAAQGIALDAGPIERLDPRRVARMLSQLADDASRREAMSGRGRSLVDGRGAERVVAALR